MPNGKIHWSRKMLAVCVHVVSVDGIARVSFEWQSVTMSTYRLQLVVFEWGQGHSYLQNQGATTKKSVEANICFDSDFDCRSICWFGLLYLKLRAPYEARKVYILACYTFCIAWKFLPLGAWVPILLCAVVAVRVLLLVLRCRLSIGGRVTRVGQLEIRR